MDDSEFDGLEAEFFRSVGSGDGATPDRVVALLNRLFPRYNWVGIYWVKEGMLELGPWSGPAATEHTSIPLGAGICGAAASSGRVENVGDVNADGRYLSCFLQTRSEIVVPIKSGDRVVGEIDIDCDEKDGFGPRDELFLSRVASMLAAEGGK